MKGHDTRHKGKTLLQKEKGKVLCVCQQSHDLGKRIDQSLIALAPQKKQLGGEHDTIIPHHNYFWPGLVW